MAPDGRSSNRFLIRLPLVLIVAMIGWYVARPALDAAVTGLAEVLIRAFEYPRVTTLVSENHLAQIQRSDFRSNSMIPTVPLTENHFNTIVLLALFLALPKPFSRRQLERLFMGWCILYLTQVFNLVLHVKCVYAFGLGDWSEAMYSPFAKNVYGYLRYFTDLPGRFSFPFLIWLGFNWDLVSRLLSIPGMETATEAPPRKRGKKTTSGKP
jgi:hypothetical protein